MKIINKHYRKALKSFETKIGAVITKELKSWRRDPQRGRFLRMGIWIGVFYGILVTIANIPYLMPWAGELWLYLQVCLLVIYMVSMEARYG